MNNGLNEYKKALEDILDDMNAAKESFKALNSVNIDKSIQLMEENIFRVDHQINKEPLLTNTVYIESRDTNRHCVHCGNYRQVKKCRLRRHRVDPVFGTCDDFCEMTEEN